MYIVHFVGYLSPLQSSIDNFQSRKTEKYAFPRRIIQTTFNSMRQQRFKGKYDDAKVKLPKHLSRTYGRQAMDSVRERTDFYRSTYYKLCKIKLLAFMCRDTRMY